jgi:hypothetical protein
MCSAESMDVGTGDGGSEGQTQRQGRYEALASDFACRSVATSVGGSTPAFVFRETLCSSSHSALDETATRGLCALVQR